MLQEALLVCGGPLLGHTGLQLISLGDPSLHAAWLITRTQTFVK